MNIIKELVAAQKERDRLEDFLNASNEDYSLNAGILNA